MHFEQILIHALPGRQKKKSDGQKISHMKVRVTVSAFLHDFDYLFLNGRTANVFVPAQQQGGVDLPSGEKSFISSEICFATQ